jgi:hypothetical protein
VVALPNADLINTSLRYAVEWDGHDQMAFVVDGETIMNVTKANHTINPRYPQVHGARFPTQFPARGSATGIHTCCCLLLHVAA